MLPFALAAEGYMWEKAINYFVRYHSGLWEVNFT